MSNDIGPKSNFKFCRPLVFYETMNIPDLWTPTIENINDLPLALRRYIHDLETKNDLAGTISENFRLHQEIVALRKECARLAKEVSTDTFEKVI